MIDDSGLPVIPHEWVGGQNCCGCLVVEQRGELADLACNECGQVVKTVAAAEVSLVLSQMLLSQPENCHAHCPHCGAHLELMTANGPYQIWSADLFRCKGCGAEVTGQFAKLPISESHKRDYDAWALALRPMRYWSTWVEKEQVTAALAETPEETELLKALGVSVQDGKVT